MTMIETCTLLSHTGGKDGGDVDGDDGGRGVGVFRRVGV